MKTILIPVDFSDSASAAIRYAAALATFIKATKLVLYNTYSIPIPGTATTTSDMSFSFVETDSLRKLSEDELAKSKTLAMSLCSPEIEIETISDYGFVEQQINDTINKTHADIIVMGMEDMGALEEALAGSTAIHGVHHTQIPVLLVPPDAVWQPVKNIAWACDYKNLNKSTPVWNIKPFLQATQAQLHVVHNDPAHKQSGEAIAENEQQIKEWFTGTDITFALLEEKDLKEAINHYVASNHIDMLIAIPKKHSWLEGLFSTSHTKQLAFSAHVPVLCMQAVAVKSE
jgi:nucleotide-binding universal stress UspA family protein